MICPACGSQDTRPVFADTWPGGFEKQIHRCEACGLAFVHPLPTSAQIAALYDSGDYFASDTDDHLGYTEYNPPVEWLCDVLRAACRFKPGGPALEIGSATGEFLLMARQRGFEVLGIEPSHWAAERAERAGVPTRVGLFSEHAASLAPASFGLVAMSHAIEHLDDPGETLRQCAGLLRPAGVLALWTPNYAARAWRDPQKAYGLEGREHLYYFTPDSLRRMVEAAGLRVRLLTSQPCPSLGGWLEAQRFRGKPPSLRRIADKAFTWTYQGRLRTLRDPLRWPDMILVASK